MGMRVSVYRDANLGPCSNGGISDRFASLVVVNLPGPFEPSETCPGVRFVERDHFHDILVPVDYPEGHVGPMFGGNYAGTSDSRCNGGVPLAIHDRFETAEEYERMGR